MTSENKLSEYFSKSSNGNKAEYRATVTKNLTSIENYSVKCEILNEDGHIEMVTRVPFSFLSDAEDFAEDFVFINE